MDLIQFFNCAKNPDWWHSQVIISYTGKEYPLLMFSGVLKLIPAPVSVIDLQKESWDCACARFQSSFLGNKNFFWLKNIASLESKTRVIVLDFIKKYKGPNCIIFFNDSVVAFKDVADKVSVDLPVECDQRQASLLLPFF